MAHKISLLLFIGLTGYVLTRLVAVVFKQPFPPA
jgi:hypothetical protein